MATILVYVHFLIAAAMIVLIMLQQGKGSEMGASFGGGSSNTMFGAAGGMSFFTKITAVLATLFFATSFALALSARNQAAIGFDDELQLFSPLETSETPAQPQEVPTTGAFEFSGEPAGDIPAAPEF
jgi:preprotein translocase subunit SecG|tara:strand:- start:2976 stop:3356 length:381 start_codon:yes stop_codon:yes gene_type:complete